MPRTKASTAAWFMSAFSHLFEHFDAISEAGHLRLRFTLRCGNIKATIWQNVSEKGPFFATTFSRPFKDQSGAWRNGTSFGLNDLEALMTVAHEAKQWIAAHVLKR
jgi:hypothetical protein